MIYTFIPSKKPYKPPEVFTKQENTFEMGVLEKDEIIKEAARKCKWKVGELAKVGDDVVKITSIASSIFQFGRYEEFTNPPRIIMASIENSNKTIFCSIDALEEYAKP